MKKMIFCAFGLLLIQPVSAAPPGGFSFDQLLKRHDSNQDGVISSKEFQGPTHLFSRLDRNKDGKLTRIEFSEIQTAFRNKKSPSAHRAPEGVRVVQNLEYAQIEGQSLKLDLYLPENSKETDLPLLLWIHGGGWRNGDKANVNWPILRLSEAGYAIASINYRLKDISIHPKNIHDCKGALRWLRAHAEEYGIDPSRIAACGSSAGGHLALLLGLSSGEDHLEGTVGGNIEYAGPVQAIVDLYGPADLLQMAEKSPRFNSSHSLTKEQIANASPLTYLDDNDPPILILQGDQDKTVPAEQSHILHKHCQSTGVPSELHILQGAGHGGPEFADESRYELIKAFLDRHL